MIYTPNFSDKFGDYVNDAFDNNTNALSIINTMIRLIMVIDLKINAFNNVFNNTFNNNPLIILYLDFQLPCYYSGLCSVHS